MTKYGLTKPYFVNEGKFNLNIFEVELNKILKKGETINAEYYKRRILPMARKEGNRLCHTDVFFNKMVQSLIQRIYPKPIGN